LSFGGDRGIMIPFVEERNTSRLHPARGMTGAAMAPAGTSL
jgi:hypothetical protein